MKKLYIQPQTKRTVLKACFSTMLTGSLQETEVTGGFVDAPARRAGILYI